MLVDINRDLAYAKEGEEQPFKCPQCGGIMISMGLDFKSPKKEDVRAWSHIESLYEVGITFHSCGCSGPGYIPRDKVALMAFLEEKRSVYIENLRFGFPMKESNQRKLMGVPLKLIVHTCVCFQRNSKLELKGILKLMPSKQ